MSMVSFKKKHLLERHVQKEQLAEQTTSRIRKSGFLNWSLSPLHLLLLPYAFGPLRRLLFKSIVFQPVFSTCCLNAMQPSLPKYRREYALFNCSKCRIMEREASLHNDKSKDRNWISVQYSCYQALLTLSLLVMLELLGKSC